MFNIKNDAKIGSLDDTDRFDDDVILNDPKPPVRIDSDEPGSEDIKSEKIINTLLQQKGILAPDKVLYEVEEGKVEEKNFYDLPLEDQIAILSEQESTGTPNLSQEDQEIIELQRQNNLTLAELIQYYQNASIEEFLQQQGGQTSVADYTDEEIYMLDMKSRLGDSVSDEEIMKALENELELPELFKKKVDKMRSEYIQLEAEEKRKDADKVNADREEAFQEFSTGMKDYISSVEDIGGVLLEDTDKNDIVRFMLERDERGVTQFQKQMQNPENLFLASWALLKLEDTFNLLKEHYEGLVKGTQKRKISVPTPVTVVKKDPKGAQKTELTDLYNFD